MAEGDNAKPTGSPEGLGTAVARNILVSMLGFAWPVALLVVSTPIVFRGLGDAGFGVWSLVGNVIGYLGIFNSLQTAGTKYLAEYLAINDRVAIRRLLGTSLIFNLAMGILGGAAIFAMAYPLATRWLVIPQELQREALTAFRIAGFGFFVNAIGWWGASILAGAQRYDWLAGIISGTATVAAVGSIVAVEWHFGVVGVAIANVFSAALATGLYAWAGHRVLGAAGLAMEFDSAMLRHVLSYGMFSTLHVIFGVITTQLDRTLLGVWVGAAAVALYSIPLSVATRVHQFAGSALEVVLPLASAIKGGGDGNEKTGRLFIRMQSVNLVLVLVFATPILALAPQILSVWIGATFAHGASHIFQLLVIAYLLLGVSVAASGIVAGVGHPEVNAGFAAALGIANGIGYVAFIPRWGAVGAAAASAIGSVVAVPLFLWYVRRRFLGVGWIVIFREAFARPVGAAIPIGLLTFTARSLVTSLFSLAVVAAISCLAYLGLAAVFGVWHPRHVPLLNRAWAAVH